jgi:hypothetical protein
MTLMPQDTYESRLRLLHSGFRFADQPLSYGRAELYTDRIRLSPWGKGRRHPLVIPLEAVASISWPGDDDAATTFHLTDGSLLPVRLGKHDVWRRYLESRLEWRDRKNGSALPARSNWTLRDIIHYSGSMS